ncbi:MAG TPA: methyltransferase domain-containing protein [Kofleriaceae bacterium]
MTTGYLHGYSDDERARLRMQARVLSPWVHRDLPYANSRHLLEVGCGSGAQLELLLDAFPELHVTGLDRAVDQLDAARRNLAGPSHAARATLVHGAAEELPLRGGEFDAAFLCWILEHVVDPAPVLREVFRVLAPGSPIVVSEVMNATLYLQPSSPHVMRYWSAFNNMQIALGGDPYVGAKLGHHLHHAGFRNIELTPRGVILDDRDPSARAALCAACTDLLLSAAPALLAANRVTGAEIDAVGEELDAIGRGPGSVFFYVIMQARAAR